MCSKIWVIAQSGKEASNESTDFEKWANGVHVVRKAESDIDGGDSVAVR